MPCSEESSISRAARILIRGRVQGVGYRYFTRSRARALGVRGSVRNLPDGRVEVLASAPSELLNSFIEQLRTGPVGAHVTGCEVVWMDRLPANTDFDIEY